MPGGLTAQHLLFFAILLGVFVLLATERIRNDVVAVMIILALMGTGLLEPREALAGFASEPAIVVASVFVLSAALYRTGVSQALGRLNESGDRFTLKTGDDHFFIGRRGHEAAF